MKSEFVTCNSWGWNDIFFLLAVMRCCYGLEDRCRTCGDGV